MKIRQVDDQEGRRTFVMVCEVGDDPVESLTAAAKRFDLRAATLSGIGAFSAVTLGFFDHARRDYRRRVIREQVEVVSLLGNVALDGGSPGSTPTWWWAGPTAGRWAATCWAAPSIPRSR